MDSNVVTLSGIDISDIGYVDGSFVITPGQDWLPPLTIARTSEVWTLTALANHQGSSGVAAQFYTATGGQVGPVSHAWSPNATSDLTPTELNFYFAVTLLLGRSAAATIYLGQGHIGFPHDQNNWWIGGESISSTEPGQNGVCSLKVGGAAYMVTGDDNAFVLTQEDAGLSAHS
jgi:hypothetical protein